MKTVAESEKEFTQSLIRRIEDRIISEENITRADFVKHVFEVEAMLGIKKYEGSYPEPRAITPHEEVMKDIYNWRRIFDENN